MDDMEIDPELVARMGFSSFGTVSKKRKFNADEAIADMPSNTNSATGSNSQPLGQPLGRTAAPRPSEPSSHEPATSTSESADIRALARGVRNKRGDMIYYLPSFLEDPWQSLRKKKS